MTKQEFYNREYLTKAECAALIGCSEKTIQRLIASRQLAAVRHSGKVYISKDSLLHFTSAEALQFDGEACASEVEAHEQGKSKFDLPPVSNIAQPESDRTFAELYLSGQATDSAGNFYDGRNANCLSGQATLLGPVSATPIQAVPENDSTAHMDKALVGDTLSPEAYAEAVQKWRRGPYRNIPSVSAQSRKAQQDRTLINAAFRYAR